MDLSPISLTEEQRQALHATNDRGPVLIPDTQSQKTYVLIRSDIFDRYRALLSEDEFQVMEAYGAMDEIASREGWLDPEMDAYDSLDPRRSS